MKRMRAVAAVASVTLVAGALVSPGLVGAQDGSAPPADDRKVELSFMNWFYDGPMKAAYDSFIEDYLAEESRVTGVAVETQPFVRYHDVLNVKLGADNPPNVAWIHASLADAYVNSGRLLDLMPIVEAWPDFDLADFSPSSLEPWMRDGKLYGLPFTNASNVVFYNKGLFEQAGVRTPDDLIAAGEWTWDNMRAISKELVDKQAARYGFVLGNNIYTNGWRNLVEVYGPFGAAPWSADGKTCLFNSPETVAATQFVWDMVYADKSHPEPGVDANFATGDIGMNLTRPSFAFQWDESGFEWGVVPQPAGPAGFVPSRAQNGIAAFAEAPNSDLAGKFVVSTLTRDHAIEFQGNTASNRQSTFDTDTLQAAFPAFTPEQVEATVVAALKAENSVLEYSHPNFGPVNSNAQQVFDGQVWTPDANIQAAMDTVCANITPLLGT